MTQAQKIAKDKFKKAIAYRTKTGVSLKEAFAHIYGKKKAAPKNKAASKKVSAIKIVEKGESKKTKASATYQQIRTKKGTFKGLKKIGSVKKSAPKKSASKRFTDIHKDNKSHNVNIRVVSGFMGRLIVKTFTLSDLKKMNPIYFEKGKDKFAGIYKRKLIVSKKLNSQVMIEAKKDPITSLRSYSVRLINAEGSIGNVKKFDTIYGAAEYIGKNIIL
jgi:hypothetical protein